MQERPMTLEVETRFFLPGEHIFGMESEIARHLNARFKRCYLNPTDIYPNYSDSSRSGEWFRLRYRKVYTGERYYIHTGKQIKRKIGTSENDYKIEAYLEMPESVVRNIDEEIMKFGVNNCLTVHGLCRITYQTYFKNQPITLSFDSMYSPHAHYKSLLASEPPVSFIEVGTEIPINRSRIDIVEIYKKLVRDFIVTRLEGVLERMDIKHETKDIYPMILIEQLKSLSLQKQLPITSLISRLYSDCPVHSLKVEND